MGSNGTGKGAMLKQRRVQLQVEELESRTLPTVTTPLPPYHPLPAVSLAQVANLESQLDAAQTAVDTDVTRQLRELGGLSRDRADLAALRTKLAWVRADIAADVTATAAQKADDWAEANRLAGWIRQLQLDITSKQHDLNLVNTTLAVDRGKLAKVQGALDHTQTELFLWPNIQHAVMLLRSDLVSRDQFNANLDRAHYAIAADLTDLQQDPAPLAADRTRAHQLQVRLSALTPVIANDRLTRSPKLAADLAAQARLTAWLKAEQASIGAEIADHSEDRIELTADAAKANAIMQQAYQAQYAVATGWRTLLFAYITPSVIISGPPIGTA